MNTSKTMFHVVPACAHSMCQTASPLCEDRCQACHAGCCCRSLSETLRSTPLGPTTQSRPWQHGKPMRKRLRHALDLNQLHNTIEATGTNSNLGNDQREANNVCKPRNVFEWECSRGRTAAEWLCVSPSAVQRLGGSGQGRQPLTDGRLNLRCNRGLDLAATIKANPMLQHESLSPPPSTLLRRPFRPIPPNTGRPLGWQIPTHYADCTSSRQNLHPHNQKESPGADFGLNLRNRQNAPEGQLKHVVYMGVWGKRTTQSQPTSAGCMLGQATI